MRKNFAKIFVLLLIALTMPAVVYYVNPDNRFNSENYAQGIAGQLLNHKNITGTFNYDKRLVLKHYISELKTTPDVIILGGSRTMLIDSTFFPSSNIFVLNCGVNSATLEDEMAIYDMFVQNGRYPKKVILAIDPYYFNDNNPQKLYGPVREFYYDMCNRIGKSLPKDNEFNFKYGIYKDLFNPYYFQKSLLYWIGTGNDHSYEVTDKEYNEKITLLDHGSITYDKAQREWPQEVIDENARNYLSDGLAYMKNFNRISPSISNKYEKFLDYLKNQKVDVSILFEPYHPICYKKFITDPQYKATLETESYCRTVSSKKHVPFFGTLNPEAFGLSNTDFYDGAHLKKEPLRKVLKIK